MARNLDSGSMSDSTEARSVLARNIRRLIERDAGPAGRLSVRAWALSRGLDVRLIDRLTKGEHATTLDNLEKVAQACGLKVWQLLYDELDPADPPATQITEQDRETIRKLRRLLGE